ncbi:hypothetical protein OGZ37_13340 [Lactococcus lactis]|uniref:hypothetical protein n=1 Tax=Lactococcus lactis TaxID=1358 RepID=UPI00241825CA|nr:hypothetical protein [Lactococcus lactis]MDG4967534.1 hypothetical protein [Lactococcus lactis]
MATKKNFGNTKNPALAFLGKIEEEEEEEEEKVKIDKKSSNNKKEQSDEEIDYKKKIKELEDKLRVQEKTLTETKSKKINLLIYPSVLSVFDKVAKLENKSRNDLANIVFKEYCEKYPDIKPD